VQGSISARDEHFIARCIELAEANLEIGELPFGSLITLGDEVITEAASCVRARWDNTAHAELTALRAAQRTLQRNDFSSYTIYSNFEPCAMCAFVIRELKFGRVVFALPSPNMGGYTRWDILQDTGLSDYCGRPPEVTAGILAERARVSFHGLRVTW
jgi:tRNA(adenine34) deaminase